MKPVAKKKNIMRIREVGSVHSNTDTTRAVHSHREHGRQTLAGLETFVVRNDRSDDGNNAKHLSILRALNTGLC